MPNPFHLIPDHFKTQGMRTKAIEVKPCQLYYFQLYTSLQYVPDYFVTQQLITKQHDDDYDDGGHWDDDDDDDENKIFVWYDGYQKRKAQKAKIKEELLFIAWHPDRAMDWCMPGDEIVVIR